MPSALLALGKCGGRELGFGSDLELMLVYDDRDLAEVVGTAAAGAAFDRFVTTLRQALAGRRGGRSTSTSGSGPTGGRGPPATALSAFAALLPGRRPRLGL